MNNTNIQTRLLNTDDITEHAVLFDAYRQFYKQNPDFTSCKNYLLGRMSNHEIICHGAFINNALVGIAHIYTSFSSLSLKPLWILNDLYVDKAARRKGIATILIDAVRTHAYESGVMRLKLQTEHKNLSAQKCYEQYGWEKDGFLPYSIGTDRKDTSQ